MKRNSWLLWALSASAFLAIALWWSQPKSVESVAVSKGTITQSIDAARATVNVRLLVDTPPDFLKPDMTVSVEMHTNAATNALILPTDAIHNADSDQPWVQIIRDGKAQQQAIQTGIRGIGNTQVLAGLNEGDWVITQINVKNDSRVEAKAREKQTIRGFDLPNGFK